MANMHPELSALFDLIEFMSPNYSHGKLGIEIEIFHFRYRSINMIFNISCRHIESGTVSKISTSRVTVIVYFHKKYTHNVHK